jgi:hypothetical protein
MGDNKKKPKTLKQLRKSLKVRTLRDNLDFVPEPPGQYERKRDQEYSQDNWNNAVEDLGHNPNSLINKTPSDELKQRVKENQENLTYPEFVEKHYHKEEITLDGGEIEVTVTPTELQMIHAKLDRLDGKIEYLLKYLEI